jgi:hypothetical protein
MYLPVGSFHALRYVGVLQIDAVAVATMPGSEAPISVATNSLTNRLFYDQRTAARLPHVVDSRFHDDPL